MSHDLLVLPAADRSVGRAVSTLRSPLSALLASVQAVLGTALLWQQRRRERHELAAMDDRMRRDIGLSTVDAWREINKPLWRA